MLCLMRIKQWYNGKRVKIDNGQPDTIGGLPVMQDYRTEYHWTARLVRAIFGFCGTHWQWLITTAISIIAAVAAVLAVCPG